MRRIPRAILAATAAAGAIATMEAHAAPDAPNRVCERYILRAAKTHAVPVGVLYAVGLTETGRKGSLQPYAMNVEGASRFPAGLDAALVEFAAARRRGATLIDVGCMQINHRYHGARFASVAAMFEPAANVDYAARFLVELYGREKSWTRAVARYHAGPNNDPAQKRYVCAVMTNMVAVGFGRWTARAREFCVR